MMTETHGDHEQAEEPTCSMHEVHPSDGAMMPDMAQARDVAQWRRAERERLIAARLALTVAEREAHARLVARDLDTLVLRNADTIVGLYWPFRGEPDLRAWMQEATAAGLRSALPVVIAKGQPLEFREWKPGTRLERGIWNIPYPADGIVVAPTVVIAPLVGFDPAGYRLGYGGGFFDRTLAAMSPRPLSIGVGHPVAAIPTIYPQRHDIPMDWIVTGLDAPRERLSRTKTWGF